jgi:hypothetical protein
VDWGLLAWMAFGAVAFGVCASVLVQWTSGRSAAFSIGVALFIVLALAAIGLMILRNAAAAIP